MPSDIAHLCHVSPGRLRIRIPGRRGDAAYFEQTRDYLETLDGVDMLQVNPLTGSIIIEHDNLAIETLLEKASRAGLFTLQQDMADSGQAAPPGPALTTFDVPGLLRLMPSAGDTRNIAVLVLVVMALLQLYRGRIMVPAMSLLWYAFELSRR